MAYTFLNNSPIPTEICTREPALKDYGFYRRLNNGKYEFISFCDERANQWISVHQRDFNKILDELLPSRK